MSCDLDMDHDGNMVGDLMKANKQLQAENKRLREALEKILNSDDLCVDDDPELLCERCIDKKRIALKAIEGGRR